MIIKGSYNNPSRITYDGNEIGKVCVGDKLVWENGGTAFKVRLTYYDGTVKDYPVDGNNELDLYELYVWNGKTFNGVKRLEVGEGVSRIISRISYIGEDPGISEFIFPMSVKEYNVDSTNLFKSATKIDTGGFETIPANAFRELYSLDTLILHSGLKAIGQFAFVNAIRLLDIEIPDTVTDLSESSFYITKTDEFVGLRNVRIYATEPPKVGISTFNYNFTYPIYVPDESVEKYKNYQNWINYYADRIFPMSEYK